MKIFMFLFSQTRLWMHDININEFFDLPLHLTCFWIPNFLSSFLLRKGYVRCLRNTVYVHDASFYGKKMFFICKLPKNYLY